MGYVIYLKSEARQKCRKKFGVSEAYISEALNFKKHSVLCRQIRTYAVNFCNGILFGK